MPENTAQAKRATFTPGPWVAVPMTLNQNYERTHFKDGTWWILPENDTERLPICIVDHGNDHDAPTRQQSEIDAHLIAACLELYDALKNAHRYLFADDGPDEVDRCELATQIEAAIAKAEGRNA